MTGNNGKKCVYLRSYPVNLLVILLLSSGLSLLGLILSDVMELTTIIRYLTAPALFLLNTIPLLLLMLLIYHLTSRLWASFGMAGGLFLIMQIVNRFKIQLRAEPLLPTDILLGMEAANVVNLKELPISFIVVASIVLFLLVFILLFVFVSSKKLSWPLRIIGAFLPFVLFFGANNIWYKNNDLFSKFAVRGSVYSTVNQFKSRGFVYSFLVKANRFKFEKPAGYSRTEAKKVLAKYQKTSQNAAELKLPHIIAVMGEAFYDIDRIPDVKFNDSFNPLENYKRITSEAYSGRIVTSVFGGGTADTEFAFLTGHSQSLFSDMNSPYMLYLRKNTFSLPRVLEKAGYAALAFHPGEPWFYNRNNVYGYFGFDEIYFKNSMDLSKVTEYNGYISDMDTAGFMLEKLKEHIGHKPDTPYFNFTVTIENHGPYSDNDIGYPKILKKTEAMDKSTYNILNNYINGLSRCDKALGYLTDSLGKLDEPVVLIYFADHLPFLGQNYQGYKALNFKISQTEDLEAYLNQYETPYFIWSNDAAKRLLSKNKVPFLSGKAPEISANYLATELLDYIGLDGGAYFDFLKEYKEALPVITKRFFKENGTFTEKPSEKSMQMLEQYRKIQYYMMLDKDAVIP